MKVTDVPFAVLRLNYRVARLPLQVIEDRVMTRLDAESPARLIYERSFGLLDVRVGSALGDSTLEQRGAARAERSAALHHAAHLDAAATRTIEESGREFQARRDDALRRQQQAQETGRKTQQRARATAQDRKRRAAQDAEERAGAVAQRAEAQARQRAGAVRDARDEEEAQIEAAERAAEQAAEILWEDADDKRADAAAKRRDADRLDELTAD